VRVPVRDRLGLGHAWHGRHPVISVGRSGVHAGLTSGSHMGVPERIGQACERIQRHSAPCRADDRPGPIHASPHTQKETAMADERILQEVAGKVAIVTGAASGIGRATTELFAERGARVVALDQDEAVNALASDSVLPMVADVAADGSAEAAVAAAIDRFGRLDVLVNNAGYINYQSEIGR